MENYWEFAAAGLIVWVLFVLYVTVNWLRDKWRWRHAYNVAIREPRQNVRGLR